MVVTKSEIEAEGAAVASAAAAACLMSPLLAASSGGGAGGEEAAGVSSPATRAKASCLAAALALQQELGEEEEGEDEADADSQPGEESSEEDEEGSEWEEEEVEYDFTGAEAEADATAASNVLHRVYAEHPQILDLELSSELVNRIKVKVNCCRRSEAHHVALTVSQTAEREGAAHERCGRKGAMPVFGPMMKKLKSLPASDGRAHQRCADASEVEQYGKSLVMSALHAEK